MGPLRRFGFVLAASVLLALVPRLSADAADTYYVSPDGNDSGSGTQSSPWASFSHALSRLEAGDTLVARGGTYREDVSNPNLSAGTKNNPITVRAARGERPVIKGLVRLTDPDYWRFDGINVTWGGGDPDEHMLKVTGGTGWQYLNSEIWGAQSYAGMLIAEGTSGEPTAWRVAGNCIHDTGVNNDRNQDHLIYANSGTGSGKIEGNVMFGAPNGEAVKLGGPSPDSGGTSNVTVRYNTMVDTAQTILISWNSSNNLIENNILVGTQDNYSNIRAYQISGHDNQARNNLGAQSDALISNYDGGNGITDAGGNIHGTDPRFDSTGCNGYRPTNPAAQNYGHTATNIEGADTTTQPSPNAHSGTFRDDDGNIFETDIEQLAKTGITRGCGQNRYCPDRAVTRGQMAAFLTRALHLTKNTDQPFGDTPGHLFETDINRLAHAGITTGCNPPHNNKYCPDQPVTRAQMATFLTRARNLTGTNHNFEDINHTIHAPDIAALATAGITKGCNPPHNNKYCPNQPITRGEMAAFLIRTFNP